jgi:hypothetical protein
VVADAGLVVEPSDTAAVCDAVLGVINDHALRKGLILLGRSRARSSSRTAAPSRSTSPTTPTPSRCGTPAAARRRGSTGCP